MNANALVKNQRDNFNSNRTKPIAFRIGQLKLFLSTLKKNEASLCEAIHADYKKSAFDSFMLEFLTLYQDLEIAIRRLSRWASPKRVGTNLLNWPAKSYILPEPGSYTCHRRLELSRPAIPRARSGRIGGGKYRHIETERTLFCHQPCVREDDQWDF